MFLLYCLSIILIFLIGISLYFRKKLNKQFNLISNLRHKLYLANEEIRKYKIMESNMNREREYQAIDIRANVEVLEAKHGKDVVNDFLSDYIKQQEKQNIKDLGYKRGHA